MKILLKEFTPHHLVDFISIDNIPTNPIDYALTGHWNPSSIAHGIIAIVQVDPTTHLIEYKATKAGTPAQKTHKSNIHFPYQYYIWTGTSIKNVNQTKLRYNFGHPKVMFSPYDWNEVVKDPDAKLYMPWLTNIVAKGKYGATFCYTTKKHQLLNDLSLDKLSTIEDFLASGIPEILIEDYENIMFQGFNRDAGGIQFASDSRYSDAVVSKFQRIAKFTEEDLVDPTSDIYTKHAKPLLLSRKEFFDTLDKHRELSAQL